MTSNAKNVKDYIKELESTKNDRPQQVKEGLEIYVDLWRRAIQRGVISESDTVNEALSKLEEKGGLYKVAGD